VWGGATEHDRGAQACRSAGHETSTASINLQHTGRRFLFVDIFYTCFPDKEKFRLTN
jgi:hypothetical protein